MLLLERLASEDRKLSDGQRAVARWLVAHRNEIPNATVKRIAEETFTSPATVVRLAKSFGYTSFEPMREELTDEVLYLDRRFKGLNPNAPFAANDSVMTVATKVASLARDTVADTLALMDADSLSRAVELVDRAHRLYMAASSFPLLYAQDFMLKMRRIGKDVEVTTLAGEQSFVGGIIRHDDCAIVISYSGVTPPTLDLARMFRRREIPLVALTSMGVNPLRELADVTLTLTTREQMYPRVIGYTSHLSMKQVLDTLYSCVYVRHMGS